MAQQPGPSDVPRLAFQRAIKKAQQNKKEIKQAKPTRTYYQVVPSSSSIATSVEVVSNTQNSKVYLEVPGTRTYEVPQVRIFI